MTRQTQQLTMAFEKQSQHISGLLVELEEKENAFLNQGKELLRFKQELDAVKTEKRELMIKEEEQHRQRDETLAESSDLKQEKNSAVTYHAGSSLANVDFDSKRDTSQLKIETCDAETLPPVGGEGDSRPEEERPKSVNKNKSACEVAKKEFGQKGETADMFTELFALRQENRLLKQRIQDLTVSDTKDPKLQADSETQQDPVKQSQNSSNSLSSFSEEQETQSVPNVLINEGHEMLQNAKKTEGKELEREDWKNASGENDLEDVSDVQVDCLQQQVVSRLYMFKFLTCRR